MQEEKKSDGALFGLIVIIIILLIGGIYVWRLELECITNKTQIEKTLPVLIPANKIN